MTFTIAAQTLKGIAAYKAGLGELTDGAIYKGIAQAANAAGAKSKTQTVRSIAKATGLKAKDVRPKVKLVKASTSANRKSLEVKIETRGRRIRLIKFSAQEKTRKRQGRVVARLGVKAKPWNRPQVFQDAFIAPVRYGRGDQAGSTDGVFVRYMGATRLPIKQLYGPGIAREAERNEGEIQGFFKKEMDVQLPRKLEYQIQLKLDRKAKR